VNVGSGERISIAELIYAIAGQIGRADLVRLGALEPSAAEPAVLLPDLDRLHGELGFEPRYSLKEGLADTIAWWRHRLAT
jgi:nucleoside-diphosphate-sugar epimerase